MTENHSIESTFSYENRQIENIVVRVQISDRQHNLRYEPHEELDKKEVKEVVHVTPMQWDADSRQASQDTHYFNATADRITEIMRVKRIAEERVVEKGFKLARYREEEE